MTKPFIHTSDPRDGISAIVTGIFSIGTVPSATNALFNTQNENHCWPNMHPSKIRRKPAQPTQLCMYQYPNSSDSRSLEIYTLHPSPRRKSHALQNITSFQGSNLYKREIIYIEPIRSYTHTWHIVSTPNISDTTCMSYIICNVTTISPMQTRGPRTVAERNGEAWTHFLLSHILSDSLSMERWIDRDR